MPSSYDDRLERFVVAQDDGSYAQALAELWAGRKRSHWMWFVFPQLAGLGRSSTAKFFALNNIAEARAYLAHPVLGPRLLACTQAMLDLPDADPVAVLGEIDAVKLRSCMTIFELADPSEPAFAAVLDKFYAGQRDPVTLRLLDISN